MAQGINHYKANLRDFAFLLFEQFGLGDLLGSEPFADWDEETIRAIFDEVYRFATEVTGPLNSSGDRTGCTLIDGAVKTPDGFKDAWERLYENGFRSLTVAEEFDGQGGPTTVGVLVEELLSGSNTSFAMYPGLTVGAAELIDHFGTERQRRLYADRMYRGTWSGTMCLTEPHAGSDVGAAITRATKLDDNRYAIHGTKIFISAGDHDLTDNIVHLVLARVDGAPAGTKGLSLFIVPKVRVDEEGGLLEPNDVQTAAIEHKMGIRASSTAQLAFGENDGCVGELVGEVEHQGMRQMFRMMNLARILVGVQGLAVASSAYLNALAYAKERKQGSSIDTWKDPEAPRVAIIEHPNIRRMLLDMKARTDGIRALVVKLAMHQDRVHALKGKDDEGAAYHQGQTDLLTPLVKAYASDQSYRVCETAIQVYGGAGYLQDHPVEQYARDSKIFSIYEGTNAIQALDLVGRKLGQQGGRNAQAFLGEVQRFIDAHAAHPELAEAVGHLQKAHEAVAGSAMQFLMWFQQGKMARIPLAAERFLAMMSELAVGWLLLEQASIASERLSTLAEGDEDRFFYLGKKRAAIYFAKNVLPHVPTTAMTIAAEDDGAVEIATESLG